MVSKAMRRWSTALIVVGVAALAVFAAADALRGHGQPRDAASVPATTRERPPTLRETLRGQGVSGQIVYSDQDCILHSLVLPQMVDDVVRRDNGAGAFRYCRFSVGGGRFLDEGDVPSPDGLSIARCRGRRIVVWETETGAAVRSIRGCVPAWHPDGQLTYARDEQVLEDERVLYSRAELHRLARRHPNIASLGRGIPFYVHVLDIAWLDRLRLAMSLEVRIRGVEPQHFVVLLDGDRMLALLADFSGPIRDLLVSPAGSFLADDRGTVVTKQGRSYPLLEGIPRPSTVAFSPDEGWLAVATGASVYLVGTPRNLGRVIQLPVPAQDLAWEPGGPTIDTTTTAR
jgi:hypothetical protein